MAGFAEHGNEHSDFMQGVGLSGCKCQMITKCTPCSEEVLQFFYDQTAMVMLHDFEAKT